MEKNLNVSVLLDFYGDMLTEKQREAVECYYNDDLSLSEIADNQGISRQGVRDAIKRAEALLFEMEDRLGFAKRFQILQEGLEQIAKNAREIEEYNSRFSYSREIHDRALAIEKLADRLSE